MEAALASVDRLQVRNLGAHFEAVVFAALLHREDVIRSMEFANVDGSLDCQRVDSNCSRGLFTSFADRFWDLEQRMNEDPYSNQGLLPFDVKSRKSHKAEDQLYVTTFLQRQNVGFYIAMCAGNPDFVEVIPNRFSGRRPAEDNRQPTHCVTVNHSRKSLFRQTSYQFLSPCNSPYRMPFSLLPAALDSIRACTSSSPSGYYVNPWTKVRIYDWRPLKIHTTEPFFPNEETQAAHFTAYEGTSRIRWAIHNATRDLEFDFIYHQPRLADFKLIVTDANSPSSGQWLVQYKIDRGGRALHSLTGVPITRGQRQNKEPAYYFTGFERFDYLFYEFLFPIRQNGQMTWETWFFFLPERVLPDRFYTTVATQDAFTDPEFAEYYIKMDSGREWVGRVYAIIEANPSPRKPLGSRPLRPYKEDADTDEELSLPTPRRHLGWFDDKFFDTVMEHCARQLSGLLVVLARDHPMGDVAYCRYQWTLEERDHYLATRWPPCTISSLPANTPVVPITIYARDRVGTTRGPSLTAAEARRLHACPSPRLLCFDLFGSMGRLACCPLLLVPSDDLSHTRAQRTTFEQVLATNKREEFSPRVPLLAEQLHSGHAIADYAIGASGATIFEGQGEKWNEVWRLFDAFSDTETVPFPKDHVREAGRYQTTLQQLHQRLVEEHAAIDHRLQPSS